MPLAGGASSKAGLDYELQWTVNCMLRVMRSEVASIRLEPPGKEGEGVEFSLSTSAGIEYHQVKRQLAGTGRWSLASLASEGVLHHFYQKLNDPSATCMFVSTHAAHPLDELADRARKSENFASFKHHFLESKRWREHFETLHSGWGASSEEETYQRLARIFVRTIDEYDLRDLAESKIETCVSGNPSNVLDVLSQFAIAQTHHNLTHERLWEHLRSRGLDQRASGQENDVELVISDLTSAYLAGIQPVGIDGVTIPRPEVNQIFAELGDKESKNIVLLTGKAGVGKSSAIAQVLDEMNGRNEPVLSFRLDRHEASATPHELGQAIGLPASPVSVLANVSAGRNCMLVIDQLDAISLASGRNSDFFDCIGAMLREAKNHPNIWVLVACRKFDVENDPRIRELISAQGIAREVLLAEFDDATVKKVVAKLGIDPDSLTPKQVELLSLPVHLRMLADVTRGELDAPLRIQTAKGLYDAFWDEKKRVLRKQAGDSHVQEVADLMAESMSDRQALSVPASVLDSHGEIVDLMASENIVVKDGSRVSFFHESFFDYIFARRMVENRFDGVQFTLEQGQSLFVRSQIRQILLHQRETYPADAQRNLSALLSHPDIRAHLKNILLALVGSLDNPTQDEWVVIEPLLGTEHSDQAWRAINGSTAWFDLLDSIGVIRQWLRSDDEKLLNRAIWFLVSIQDRRADRVAEHLSPFLGVSDSWNQSLKGLIVYSQIGASRTFFDFALKTIEAGIFDDLLGPNGDGFGTWYRAKQLEESEPEMACELAAAYCRRLMYLLQTRRDTWSFLHVGQDVGGEVMERLAGSVPKNFVELLLPFLNGVLEIRAKKNVAPPWRDPVWASGIRTGGLKRGFDGGFILAMESSLRWLAKYEPEEFRRRAQAFKVSEYAAIQNLLMRAYEANGRLFANEAVRYLLEDLHGRVSASSLSSTSDRVIESLIESVSPHCSSENLAELEKGILEHYPDYELSFDTRRIRGASQLALLESVDVSRLSGPARRRLQELHRKFGEYQRKTPDDLTGGRVRSPIPKSAIAKMNDDNWLRAMSKYSSDDRANTRDDWLKGGATELSRELETQVKENPSRFARLIHRMPDDANVNYFEAILQGLADPEVDLDMELVVSACLRCDKVPNRPLGRWITQPLARFPNAILSDDALKMIAWYAPSIPILNPAGGHSARQGRKAK